MSKVAVVTDTISCIPAELVIKYGIRVIPVGLVIDRKVYPDTSLTNEKFWEMFYKAKEPVTTNAANPTDFYDLFSELGSRTKDIVCILVSKALSSTHNSAVTARDLLKQENAGLNIEIIDSISAAGAEGFIVLEAARTADAGKSLAEVIKVVQNMIPRANFFCAMETLKYLIRSGRAPKIAVIGDILKMKPIVSIDKKSGLVESVGRVRGMDNARTKMIEMMKEQVGSDKPLHVMVHYTDDIKAGEAFKEMVTSQLKCAEIYLTPYTPVMASQCGPVLAVSFYA